MTTRSFPNPAMCWMANGQFGGISVYDDAQELWSAPIGAGAYIFGLRRLPTEAQGAMTLTLTNVVVGSRYRIERQGDGSLATPTGNAEGTAASETVVITLDYYSVGNASNNLKVRVRKATSAPFYKTFESLFTAAAGAQSIYVAQIPDS